MGEKITQDYSKDWKSMTNYQEGTSRVIKSSGKAHKMCRESTWNVQGKTEPWKPINKTLGMSNTHKKKFSIGKNVFYNLTLWISFFNIQHLSSYCVTYGSQGQEDH